MPAPLPVETVPMPAPAPMRPLAGADLKALALAVQQMIEAPQPSYVGAPQGAEAPQPVYAGAPGGLEMPQLEGAAAPPQTPMPWARQWQEYLAQQAAYRQQLAQVLHGLGPYGNALTLPQVGDAVNSRRKEVMEYLMGGGPRSFPEPQG